MNFNFCDTLDPKKNRLVEKYVLTMRLHRMFLERELNKSGVFRSQHQILMHISQYPNASQKEIATRHHVSTATIAVSLKKLEKGGYIRRMTDQADNRYNQICLTDKGQAVVEDSIKVFKRLEEALFDTFSDEEMEQFESFLDRVRLNLEHLFQEQEQKAEPMTNRSAEVVQELTVGRSADMDTN